MHKFRAGLIVFVLLLAMLSGDRTIDQEITYLRGKLGKVSGKARVDTLNKLAFVNCGNAPKECIESGNISPMA